MSVDQKRARWFGVLYLLTFITSIPALLLYEPALRHPVAFIAGSGNVNKIYLGALLELLLILANIGTAVVIVPIMRRQFEELSIGYVTARIIESTFILVGIVAMLGIATLQQQTAGAAEGTVAYTLAAIKDWTFILGPGWMVGWGNGLILGYMMYRTQLVPRAWTWLGLDRRAADHHLGNDRHVPRRTTRAAACRAFARSPKPHGSCSSASTARSGASGAMRRSFPMRQPMTTRHRSRLRRHSRCRDRRCSPSPWQRLLALSGVVFAPLFVVGWLTSAVSNSPNYIASDQKWIKWAHDDHIKGRVSSFALVLAAFVFIYFLGALRSALEEAESSVRGSKELARVAFAGALTGIVGITMAFVSIANASAPGANADPVVSKAVTTSAAGPFLVGAAGFSAFLLATGVLTLRTGVLARWTGFVALIGAGCFFDHAPDDPQQLRERKRVRLRVLPGHAVVRRVDGRNQPG